ncbi:MAG: SPFH domain-containing protein [Peptostreptococcaceae bacterium]
MRNKFLIGVISGIVLFLLGMMLTITKIPVGYVGMVYSANGVENKPLQQGWHIIAPWKKVTDYNISLEQAFLSEDQREGSKHDDSFSIPSRDGKVVKVDFEFSYRFNEENIVEIYKTFRGKSVETIKDTFMRAKIKAWASEVSSKYTVIDIYGDGRINLNRDVHEHLKKKFSEYGIEIESANFSRIKVDPKTEEVIQENINAKQRLVKSKLEIEEEIIKTEIVKQQAEKKKIEIDLANYKIVADAEAEAEANNLRNKTITQEMIELEKIRKWDGKMPTYQGGGNPIINLSK